MTEVFYSSSATLVNKTPTLQTQKSLLDVEDLLMTWIFQPQKKKKDRRKGKGGDVGGADKDVMLKLKKLSVQASDEEEEPGKTDSKSEKEWF